MENVTRKVFEKVRTYLSGMSGAAARTGDLKEKEDNNI